MILQKIKRSTYQRKLNSLERRFFSGMNANVTMVTRIRGKINRNELVIAATKVQKMHNSLSLRLIRSKDGDIWFTSEGVEPIEVKAFQRRSNDQWIQQGLEEFKIAFEFEKRPPIR
ncbi:MAG: hypothetical protein ACFFBD_12060, partial [Candidatus Hodarchaeota archaeon]